MLTFDHRYLRTQRTDREKHALAEKALLEESARLEAEREARELELSLKISAEQNAEQERRRFAETECLTSKYVIQFRCPNGILKRHFLPTDRWNVEVYQYVGDAKKNKRVLIEH